MSAPTRNSIVEQLSDALRDCLPYACAEESFCPHFSDVGLSFAPAAGIAHVHLHTHHAARTLGQPWLALPGLVTRQIGTPLGVTQHFPGGCLRLAFYARNAWLIEITGLGMLRWSLNDPQLREIRTHQIQATGGAQAWLVGEAYVPTGHPADPDPHLPLAVGLRVLRGQATWLEEGLTLESDADGMLLLAMTVQAGDVRPKLVVDTLGQAPASLADAQNTTAAWWRDTLGTLDLTSLDAATQTSLAQAALTLAFNTVHPPENTPGSVSTLGSVVESGGNTLAGTWTCPVIYPQRQEQPAVYAADTCIHNLALEIFSPAWAREHLRWLLRQLRGDGKLPRYLCSTWSSPQAAPPRLGWAGLRLLSMQPTDDALARELLEALIRNNEWWISQRMTRTGLVMEMEPAAVHGAERASLEPMLSVALNSELLVQCRAAAVLARKLHREELAAQQQGLAQHLAQRLVVVLYDEAAQRFVDRRLDALAPRTVPVMHALLPVWAGVPLEYPRIRAMIETHLLQAGDGLLSEMVADPGVFYLILELLRAQGYEQHARRLASRWLEASAAEEGQMSLAAAVRLRVHHELNNREPSA